MKDLLENPVFWRGLQGTIQTLGLIICGLCGLYLAFKNDRYTSELMIKSPLLQLFYNGRTIGVILIVISGIGLALGLTSGKATRETKNANTIHKDFLKYHGDKSVETNSAKEWYLLLAKQYDFKKEPLSDHRMRDIIARMSKTHPEMPVNEIKAIINKYNPTEHLVPILEDLISNLPHKYKNMGTTDIYAGELPSSELSAAVITPGEGCVIILTTGISASFHQWIKPLVYYLIDKNENDRALIIKKLKNSIEAYVSKNELPNFREYDNPDVALMSTIISSAAVEFIIAHEYAHIVLSRENVGAGYDTEVEADLVAVEMVMHNLPEQSNTNQKERIIPDVQMGLCGILCAATFMMLLERCPTNLRNRSPIAHKMMARYGSIRKKIETEYDIDRYEFFRSFAGMLGLLEAEMLVEKPPVDEMTVDDKYLAKIYLAYKNKEFEGMKNIIKNTNDKVLYDYYIDKLLDASMLFSKETIADGASDWSNGDFLNSADHFRIACNMHKARLSISREKEISRKSVWLYGFGEELLESLRVSANNFRARGDYSSKKASNKIENQIRLIEIELEGLEK